MPSNFGAAVYGLITVGALLAAESAASETYRETVAGAAVTLLLYLLAHSYADFVSERMEHGQRFTLGGFAHALWRQLPILGGASPPLLAVLICWAVGTDLDTAISAGVWTSAATILAVELAVGIRARVSGRELLISSLVGAILGVLVLLLRVALH